MHLTPSAGKIKALVFWLISLTVFQWSLEKFPVMIFLKLKKNLKKSSVVGEFSTEALDGFHHKHGEGLCWKKISIQNFSTL